MNMKIVFGAVVFFVCVVTQAATPSFNSFDLTQFQTNGLVIRAKSGMLLTNPVVNSGRIIGNGSGLTNLNYASLTNVPAALSNVVNLASNNYVGAFIGNGAGLTNLAVLTTNSTFVISITTSNLTVTNNAFINSITVTNNSFFKGNAQFTSNAYFLNLNFATNLATTLTIVVGQTAQAVQTNNNIVFTGYSGIDGTNAQPFTLLITNTASSASVKFVQLPTGTLVLSSPFTNVFYLTNQVAISGWLYPGFGTNCTIGGN